MVQMPDKEFNLLFEPWILALRPDGVTEEVSLMELLRRSPEFQELAGELPTQDMALLRLLLAVLHAVFGRRDIDGKLARIESPSDALGRWKTLWNRGNFPMDVIENYLLQYKDRFFLFHPEHPFYQVAGLDKSTYYTAAKLNGELSESSNKIRLFPQRTGDGRRALRYSEAARWLLYVNTFDDTSAKPKEKGLPSPGVGWLGKLGLVAAIGDNLFETLLLNLVFLMDGGMKLWGEEKPLWESNTVKSNERTEITMPDNPSELLTLQSRRLLLKRLGNAVVGYGLLGGDFFPKENAFSEQMTVWGYGKGAKDKVEKYRPRRHSPTRRLWRDFSTLVVQAEGKHRPGVVSWLARLKSDCLISRAQFRFKTTAVHYGDKDFFADDVFSDSLSLNAGLLTTLGEHWVSRIIGELETTEQLVQHLGYLAQSLAKAAGNEQGEGPESAAKEQAYFLLDAPFRQWLEEIKPEQEEMSEVCDRWWEQAKRMIRDLGEKLVRQSGRQAFVGHVIKEGPKGKKVERRYTAPEAYNCFLRRTATRQALKGGEKHE